WRAAVERLAVEAHLALVGPVEAEEDVHEGRLARPVLAQQGVDLTALDGEVHALARDDAGEPLGDAPELDLHRALRVGARRSTQPSSGDVWISPSMICWRSSSSRSLTSCGTWSSNSWNGRSEEHTSELQSSEK